MKFLALIIGNLLMVVGICYGNLLGFGLLLTVFGYFGLIDWIWMPEWLRAFFHFHEDWMFPFRLLFVVIAAGFVVGLIVQVVALPGAILKVIGEDG